MSASVDQTNSKVQTEPASNGPSKHADYGGYVQGQQQPQASYMSPRQQGMIDPYMQSYYTTPYVYPPAQGQPMGPDASWSAAEPVSYMTGGYNYGGAAMYNQFDYQPYGWFPGSEYSSDWGMGADGGYYTVASGTETYGALNGGEMDGTGVADVDAGMKGVEHSMKSMGLGDSRDGGAAYTGDGMGGYNSRSAGTASANSTDTTAAQKKTTSWAGVASQPANSTKNMLIPRAPVQPGRGGPQSNVDISWDMKNNRQGSGGMPGRGGAMVGRGGSRPNAGSYRPNDSSRDSNQSSSNAAPPTTHHPQPAAPVDKLMNPSLYNPKEFDLTAKGARFFVIKSYSEDDIHRSIKYSIWCSTEYGNKRLDAAFREREGKGKVYLLFSVNGSGHFCGMAEMLTPVDYDTKADVWVQDKWKGTFKVKWIYVKDVPNSQLRHIRLENNEGKPVTNSRDTQEVLGEKGPQVLRIIHQYRHTTSIFDDFGHYEKRQEEGGDDSKINETLYID